MPAEESRAVDDVGAPFDDQLDELRELFRRVLEVGVLDDDDVAGDRGEPAPERRPLALIPLLQQQREAVLPLQCRSRCSRVPSVEQSSTTIELDRASARGGRAR